MIENNDILKSLLMEMKIKTHYEGKDRYVNIKLTDLYQFCIKLLELEGKVE